MPGQKRSSDDLELKSQTAVSGHMGATNWTHILLEEWWVLLTPEPSLQQLLAIFKLWKPHTKHSERCTFKILYIHNNTVV